MKDAQKKQKTIGSSSEIATKMRELIDLAKKNDVPIICLAKERDKKDKTKIDQYVYGNVLELTTLILILTASHPDLRLALRVALTIPDEEINKIIKRTKE